MLVRPSIFAVAQAVARNVHFISDAFIARVNIYRS
jgi:hypothetical protein